MKKLFFGLTFLILILLGAVYALLFTSTGNSIVASIVESKVNNEKVINFKINKFLLTTKEIEFDSTIDDNSNIKIIGDLSLFSKTVDIKFDINIKDLSKLQRFTNQKLNGSFSTSGSFKGDSTSAKLEGSSDIFKSKTTYDIDLENFEPSNILFNVKSAKIDEILHLINKPRYAMGNLDINANISNAKLENLNGEILTKITNGLITNSLVNKDFNTKLIKKLNFNGTIKTNLEPFKALSKVDVYTSMANLFVKKADVNLKNMNIKSDYFLKVDDLSKLFDVTQTKMRGNIGIAGDIKKDKDLLVNGYSELLEGQLKFKLLNNDFSANIDNVEILKVLHMLYYPEIFTSKTKLKLDYNIAKENGDLTGDLINGQFKKNEYSTIISSLARFDLTKEVYENIDLKSNINKNIIKSTIKMNSKLSQIEVNPSVIDTKNSIIDALVITQIKGIKFDTKISGDLSNPSVKVDTKKLLESGAKQKVKEKIQDTIEKKLGDKAGNILKGFFK
ncbi:MAG: hypothetical protein C0626_09910 [Arcobacter sp.]|uniref:hypothetical protein n=1 Tax=uncultured Arcobacter sp. TaxID=165434 RepID=UPI000CB4C3AF|nr:hypothetical protein [uncultured Arcobacter sp.]PLY09300.1 MAG: hypothetical protein C0626_09910 [Arcobacter sp.]